MIMSIFRRPCNREYIVFVNQSQCFANIAVVLASCADLMISSITSISAPKPVAVPVGDVANYDLTSEPSSDQIFFAASPRLIFVSGKMSEYTMS